MNKYNTTKLRFEQEIKKEAGIWVMHVTDTKNNVPCFSSWGMPGERMQDFVSRADSQWEEARVAMIKWENR
mgnify:CR=1 FL=1